MNNIERQRLLTRLGCDFQDESLFQLALTHRSHGASNNERLEFLGDSILGFVIGETLFQKFPDAKEGQLSRLRSALVKGETLAQIAREFQLGQSLNLGEGEMKSGGHRRASILADAVEAIIGAYYLDRGMAATREMILRWYATRLDGLVLEDNPKDAKTQLQEYLQANKAPLPEYVVVAAEGDAHAQQFTVSCKVTLLDQPTQAKASSRRAAEKLAAAQALALLEGR